MDELTDLALLAQRGDRMALGAFVRRSQPDVWRLCSHLGGLSMADDLTQDTYLRALRSLPGFRAESPARPWLLAIAQRTCADYVRATERRRRLLRSLRPTTSAPDAAGPAERTLLLGRLEPDRRAAFVLTQILGLTYAEAAVVCGVSVGTIRSRVARARDQLIAEVGAQAAE